jgi:hypothetical protein
MEKNRNPFHHTGLVLSGAADDLVPTGESFDKFTVADASDDALSEQRNPLFDCVHASETATHTWTSTVQVEKKSKRKGTAGLAWNSSRAAESETRRKSIATLPVGQLGRRL